MLFVRLFVFITCLVTLNVARALEANITPTVDQWGTRSVIIHLSGTIENGDLERLVQLHDRLSADLGFCGSELGEVTCEITFNSTGGNLVEGMKLGLWINEEYIPTRLKAGDICASACTLAFLGGRKRYAVASAPHRVIEAGSHLGFHGYRQNQDEEILINSAFDLSRYVNSTIIGFLDQLGDINTGWVSEVMNVPADSMYYAASPADLMALGLVYEGPIERPHTFAQNVCLNLARQALGYGSRAEHRYPENRYVGERELRETLWRQRLPDADASASNSVHETFQKLSAYEAANLLAISPGFFEEGRAERFNLEHGGGYYMSRCLVFAYANPEDGYEATIATPFGSAEAFSTSWLWGLPFRQPIWPPCPAESECINATYAPGNTDHPYEAPPVLASSRSPGSNCTLGIDLGSLARVYISELEFDLPSEFERVAQRGSSSSFRHQDCAEIEIQIQKISVTNLDQHRADKKRMLTNAGHLIDPNYQPVSASRGFWVFTGTNEYKQSDFYSLSLFQPDGTVFHIDISVPLDLSKLGSELVEAVACGARLGSSGLRC